MSQFTTILAFDFGTKNIGVALGQKPMHTVKELTPIKAKDGIPNWDDVAALVDEWQVKTFIVGLPVDSDGSDMEITRRARKFGNRLHARFGCEVVFVDETLSTREAKNLAFARGHRGNFANTPIDSIAAGVILQTYYSAYP